jgi:hypothetical protein
MRTQGGYYPTIDRRENSVRILSYNLIRNRRIG